MIAGVYFRPLRQIPDERGKIMHMLRCDAENFTEFGEIYFSTVNPGAIKGWHIHQRMTLNYAVVHGMIKLVLYDDREGSRTRGELMEIFTGQDNYGLVTVPPLIWNGFKGIGEIPMDGPAAAVAQAIEAATGAVLDRLPMTPERVLGALP